MIRHGLAILLVVFAASWLDPRVINKVAEIGGYWLGTMAALVGPDVLTAIVYGALLGLIGAVAGLIIREML